MHSVLVVDDQIANRRLLAALLEAHDLHVHLVESGEAALAYLAETLPDLILLDVMMPGLDGIEVCRRVRSEPRTALLPVVLLTALDGRDDKLRGIEAGADDFLSKPFDRNELTVRIRALLRTQDLRKELEYAQLALESERRERITSTFRRYVAPELVDHILSRPERESALGQHQRCRAVALFADLRGFTTFSEKLPADVVVELLNEFYALLAEISHRHAGVIFNMAGDCLLVAFNVVVPQADGARRALIAAEQMVLEFDPIASRWRSDHGIEAGLGIGVNEGEVVVGNVGSDRYMNFTLIGDAVNTASRLKDRARAGEILFPRQMLSPVLQTEFHARLTALPPLVLRGRSGEVSAYSFSVLPRAAHVPVPAQSPER